MEKDKRKFGFFSAEAYPSSKSNFVRRCPESPVCGLSDILIESLSRQYG